MFERVEDVASFSKDSALKMTLRRESDGSSLSERVYFAFTPADSRQAGVVSCWLVSGSHAWRRKLAGAR